MVALLVLLQLGMLLGQDGPALFAPAHESLMAPGAVRIIGRATGKAALTLDGKPVTVASPAPGVVMAEVKVTEGLHELVLTGDGGETQVSFFAGKEHNGWKMFRPHPPGGVGCDTCHAVKNGEWAMKRATLAPLCHTCHNAEQFTKIHAPHNTGTLVDCQNCHFQHGSAAKTHLRMEKAVACKQCHS